MILSSNSKTDMIIIGSGIGGLTCAALLARYGFSVVVCESHNLPGGAAHAFPVQGYQFDAGPSLFSGLSSSPSSNPLRQVLDLLEEDISWINYNSWDCYLPEGHFRAAVGAEPFYEILRQIRGENAVTQWRKLQEVMRPLKEAAIAIPPAAIRYDLGAMLTVPPFMSSFLTYSQYIRQLLGPFSEIIDKVIEDPFIRNWLDLLCFLLSGLPSQGTITAEIAYMFADWYRPGVVLDYPQGGSGAIVDALIRGLEKYGGQIRLNSHVSEIIVQNKQAIGVRLRTGEELYAKVAVISNASLWDTFKLLPESAFPTTYRQRQQDTPLCDSFLHLHLGIDAQEIREDLQIHYTFVNDWEKGITSPQNVVVASIPSVLDPSLAPPGKHVIHVYTPANEPYHLWEGIKRNSQEYQQLKEERGAIMWQALERIIPDIRSRCEVTLMGTPLTHERFLRRYRGTYGPAIKAGKSTFPSSKTPLKGLYCCGDSTFPGIGIPAVAASGMITANTLAPLKKHLELLQFLKRSQNLSA